MKAEQFSCINDLENFINGSQKVAFAVLVNKQEKYLWVQSILITIYKHKKRDRSNSEEIFVKGKILRVYATNFIVNLLSALIAYTFRDKKPAIYDFENEIKYFTPTIADLMVS